MIPVEHELETVEESTVEPLEPGQGSFYRNWIWWCSLIAAAPGLALVVSVVSGMASNGPDFSTMMWFTSIGAAFGGASTVVLPLLIGQGKFIGGDIVEGPVMPEPLSSSASSSMLSMPDSAIDYGPEDSSDETWMNYSTPLTLQSHWNRALRMTSTTLTISRSSLSGLKALLSSADLATTGLRITATAG